MPTILFDRNEHGPSARSSIPIVEQITVDLDEHERVRLSRIAAELLADEPALCSTDQTSLPALALGPRWFSRITARSHCSTRMAMSLTLTALCSLPDRAIPLP